MLVQGDDKLCLYVHTGRKKNYGICSGGGGIIAYARTWWDGNIVLYRGLRKNDGIRSYRGGGGELESVQARTGGKGESKIGKCGRTYFLDGPKDERLGLETQSVILFILENPSSSFSNREETDLGEMDYVAIKKAVQEPKKKRSNSKYTETKRYLIGKYAAIYGAAAAVKKFQKSHPHLKLGESMARHLNFQKSNCSFIYKFF